MLKKKKRLNVPNLITCIAFFVLLIFMAVMTIVLPKQDFLEMENDYAEKFLNCLQRLFLTEHI